MTMRVLTTVIFQTREDARWRGLDLLALSLCAEGFRGKYAAQAVSVRA